MPETDTFIVSPGPGEPLDYYTYLYLEELQRQREEQQRREQEQQQPPTSDPEPAFAPPVVPLPLPQLPTANPAVGLGASVLRNLLWFMFPQPTGPREHDELDPFDVIAPPNPPRPPPPGGTDPIMPPNWNDLVQWPGTPTYVPITPVNLGPVEMPPGETEVIVSPPKVVTRPTFDDEVHLPNIIEEPFGTPNFGIGARPGPAPAPTGTPGDNPAPRPADPQLEPFAKPGDRPSVPTAPDPFSAPLPDIFGNPVGDPFTPSPQPGNPVGSPGVPDFFGPFTPTFTPNLIPEPTLTEFEPKNRVTRDTCNCTKKKKKKPRKDREVCYRGTYVETKRGLSKKRLEQVPCDSARARSTTPKVKKPKLKPGQFPGLGLLGSEHLSGSDVLDLASSAFKEFAPIIGDYLRSRRTVAKVKKLTRKERGKKPKTRRPTIPGTLYSTPF